MVKHMEGCDIEIDNRLFSEKSSCSNAVDTDPVGNTVTPNQEHIERSRTYQKIMSKRRFHDQKNIGQFNHGLEVVPCHLQLVNGMKIKIMKTNKRKS